MFSEELSVLLVGDTKAVKKIVSVSLAEETGVLESRQVGIDVIMVLNSLDDVSLTVKFEHLLGNESVTVMEGHVEVGEVAVGPVEVSGVSEGTLVVRNGPGGSSHHSEVGTSLGVEGAHKSVLGRE